MSDDVKMQREIAEAQLEVAKARREFDTAYSNLEAAQARLRRQQQLLDLRAMIVICYNCKQQNTFTSPPLHGVECFYCGVALVVAREDKP